MNISQQRRDYHSSPLELSALKSNPVQQFDEWLQGAVDFKLSDPTAMTIATVDQKGQPSLRIVLLKHYDDRGFIFYTNLSSRKAKNIQENTQVALHFPWHSMNRQVSIMGSAEKLSVTEVAKYFITRPQESQLAAWSSLQSQVLASRDVLMQTFSKMKAKFAQKQIPVPDFWGGFRIVPNEFQFWQGNKNRLHDRFIYSKQTDLTWKTDRLYP